VADDIVILYMASCSESFLPGGEPYNYGMPRTFKGFWSNFRIGTLAGTVFNRLKKIEVIRIGHSTAQQSHFG
jgi:hypothetical protein